MKHLDEQMTSPRVLSGQSLASLHITSNGCSPPVFPGLLVSLVSPVSAPVPQSLGIWKCQPQIFFLSLMVPQNL